MPVTFAYRNLGAPDLYRRGLQPETAPVGVLLVDIEADVAVRDGNRVVFAEKQFPVAELACALVSWLRRTDAEGGDFEFDSMSYAELGAVRIAASPEGWRVGSVFDPDTSSAPVARDVLVAEIGRFVTAVRKDVAGLGVGLGRVPLL
jgi:hypothetical protein